MKGYFHVVWKSSIDAVEEQKKKLIPEFKKFSIKKKILKPRIRTGLVENI